MVGLDDELKKFFPAVNFRLKDFQKRAITKVLSGDNTLCIMPTGGGKSIIYQLSALKTGGVALVVSPLIALMIEQAEKLRAHGYEVLELHGGIAPLKQMQMLKNFVAKKIFAAIYLRKPRKTCRRRFLRVLYKSTPRRHKTCGYRRGALRQSMGNKFSPVLQENSRLFQASFRQNSTESFGIDGDAQSERTCRYLRRL